MRLRILGCGTSTGVPMPGCRCEVCLSGDPLNVRTRTSAVLELPDKRNILIDASTDLRHQALKWDVRNVEAVLFTHAHADHILGIDDLRSFNFVHRTSIDCYATEGTFNEITRQFYYVFNPDVNYIGGMLPQLQLHTIGHFEPFEVMGVQILPFPLRHGRLTVTGYRIGNMAYATDCNGFPPETAALLQGLDYLILDGLRFEPHAAHYTIPQAIEVAAELGVRQTYLTHMTHSVDYHETSAKLPKGVALAHDGMVIEVDSPLSA